MREKRTKRVGGYITESMKEQLELFREEESRGKVLTISDYLFGVIEEHIAIRTAMRKSPIRISHQTIGRRVGNQ